MVNADAAMLLSNRMLLPITDVLACGFDGPAAQHKVSKVTGNPVRAEIEAIASPSERFANRTGPLRVLVVGGSLGAKVLNEALPQAMALLSPEQRPQLTHQTGMANFESVKADYAKQGIDTSQGVELLPFINNMPQRLAECDVIIGRAGAITVSELCAAGVPSILVPLVVSTTAHQRDNAVYMANNGAALHLPQAEMTPSKLAELIKSLNRTALAAMAIKARGLARPRSAAAVADAIEQHVKPQTSAKASA